MAASLRAVPEKMRQGVESLFVLFAIFAEDTVVPDTVIDVVAPAMGGQAQSRMQVRRCLKQLLQANLLRGSMDTGISVHDLVRDCMIRRAETVREGGLRAIQNEAVPLLLAGFDVHGPAESYGEVRDEVEAILSDGFKKLRKSR